MPLGHRHAHSICLPVPHGGTGTRVTGRSESGSAPVRHLGAPPRPGGPLTRSAGGLGHGAGAGADWSLSHVGRGDGWPLSGPPAAGGPESAALIPESCSSGAARPALCGGRQAGCISKSGGNYLIIICNYLNYLKTRQLFDNYLIII